MNVTLKKSITIKPYTVTKYGYTFTVPTGSIVSNKTACGNDDNYRFCTDFHETAKKVSGFENSFLRHDLTYYGLNIPAEYCKPYEIN